MDTEKLLDIVNNFDKNNWSMNSYRNSIFEEYIKSFMKELNEDCKKAGWKQKDKLVKYQSWRGNGKVFCLLSPDSLVLLELGKFDLIEYIKKFEENKENIRREALQFVADYPSLSKKFDSLIDKYLEFMKERPGFIEKDKIKTTRNVTGHVINVKVQYRDTTVAAKFDMYKKVESYDFNKLCRGQSNGITGNVAYDIAYHISRISIRRNNDKSEITQKEQDFAVSHILKNEDYRVANELVKSGNLSQNNVDKLNGLLMVATFNKANR